MKTAKWVPKHRPITKLFPELIMEIMMHLDANSLRHARRAGRLFNDITKNDDFWRRKTVQDFQITNEEYDNLKGRGIDRYMRLGWHFRDSYYGYLHAAMLGLVSHMKLYFYNDYPVSYDCEGRVSFLSDYLQSDELRSEYWSCNMETMALYLAKFYQQDTVVRYLLENHRDKISPTAALIIGRVDIDYTLINDSNYRNYLESAIFADDIQSVSKLIDNYKNDFVSLREEHNYHEGVDLHDNSRSLKMCDYLMSRGVNFTVPVVIQAAKSVSFDRWMQYLSLHYEIPEGDSYLEIIDKIYEDDIIELANAIDLSIVAAVTTANIRFIQGISKLYTVSVIDLGLLSYDVNPATAKYGRNNDVRKNIIKSVEIWNRNQPGYSRYERVVMDFVTLIRNNTGSDILKLYAMIYGDHWVLEIRHQVDEIGVDRIKPVASFFHRLIKWAPVDNKVQALIRKIVTGY